MGMVIALLLGEGLCQMAFRHHEDLELSERNLLYQYSPDLGWEPIPGLRSTYSDVREIHVAHNTWGFRDREWAVDAPGPHVMFLGDSFAYGYNVEADERFTDRLQARLPQAQMLNFGVSGYGTDQEFLLLQRVVDRVRPRVVVLLFNLGNDEQDNSTNDVYAGYYKPYFEVSQGQLVLKGVPVPTSINYYARRHPWLFKSALVAAVVRTYITRTYPPMPDGAPDPTVAILEAMHDFVRDHQATLVVGVTGAAPALALACARMGVRYVDLSNAYRYADGGGHWTPEGHQFAADKLYPVLQELLRTP